MCQPSSVIPYYSNLMRHVYFLDCAFPYLAVEVLIAIATALLTRNNPMNRLLKLRQCFGINVLYMKLFYVVDLS